MNITCDSCQARYTISDEKVTGVGRVFKVPCKQCGAEIIVQGISEGEAAANSPASDATGAWYYAVGQDRQGPVAKANLADLIAAGTVTSETYVWCDGMDDWSTLGDVDELKSLLDAPSQQPAEQPVVEAVPSEELNSIESSPEPEPLEQTAPEEETSAEDLFSFDATEKSPRSSVHGRRDSSVLFSLDELSSFEEPREQDPQSFLTETSGLIDIRGLANSHQAKVEDTDNPFLSATGGASSSKPAFSLSYVPVVAKKRSPWPWVAGIAALVAIGVGVTFAVVGGDGDSTVSDASGEMAAASPAASAQETTEELSGEAPAAKKTAKVPAEKAVGAAVVGESKQGKDAAEAPESAEAGDAPEQVAKKISSKAETKAAKKPAPTTRRSSTKASRTTSRRMASKSADKKSVAAKQAPPEKAPAPKEAPAVRKPSKGVNDLLSSLSGKKSAKTTTGAAGGSGPKTLTSSTVRSKVGARKARFKSCYKMQPNRSASGVNVTLKFTIKNTGSVGSARVNGGGLTGGVQSCILRALKSIRFPVFRDAEKRVTYPLFLL